VLDDIYTENLYILQIIYDRSSLCLILVFEFQYLKALHLVCVPEENEIRVSVPRIFCIR
jgi:hypothetical protein